MSSMVQDCLMGAFKSSANDIKMAAAQKFNYIISRSILYIPGSYLIAVLVLFDYYSIRIIHARVQRAGKLA